MLFNSFLAVQILAFCSIVYAAPAAPSVDQLYAKQKCVVKPVVPPPKQLICQTQGTLVEPGNIIMSHEIAKN
jgi:hypothetical protein